MKNILLITFLTIGINSINAQKIISNETEGNLESPKPCGCVQISEVTNQNNPADILHGMGKCIELKDFNKAAKLFALSGVYGRFDMYRVKDKTAHQALSVLQQNIFISLKKKDSKKFLSVLENELKKGSIELENTCKEIQKIGMPMYYPKYMIQHGMGAFLGNKEGELVEDFNSSESWNLALKTYLHCGE